MPDLSQYTGEPLNPQVQDLCRKLEACGFVITTSNRGRASNNTSKKTLCIEWRGVYVGYMHYNLWRHGRLYGYRFNAGQKGATSVCPPRFSLDDFCQQHDCLPSAFKMYHEPSSGSYLQVVDKTTALRLLQELADDLGESVLSGSSRDDPEQMRTDLEEIRARKDVSETTRKALVDARLGQGKFRTDLLKAFNGSCAVSGLALGPALRASHIVAWRGSKDEERLDPNNGLLLSANLDALFDRYLITFGTDGGVELSKLLRRQDLDKLGPLGSLMKRPSQEQAAYLQHHNLVFERKERERTKSMST